MSMKAVFAAAALLAMTGQAAADFKVVECTGTLGARLAYDTTDAQNAIIVLDQPVGIASMGQDWGGKHPEELTVANGFVVLPAPGRKPMGVISDMSLFVGPSASALRFEIRAGNDEVLYSAECPVPRP